MSSPAEAVPTVAERTRSSKPSTTRSPTRCARPRSIVLGEDVAGGAGQGAPLEGAMGGTFGVTKGLLEEFGPRRVRDTPISEAGFVGAASAPRSPACARSST